MTATARTQLRPAFGSLGADDRTRRYDAPAARGVSRYDAPTYDTTSRRDVPAARITSFRAPSSRSGTTYGAAVIRRRAENGA